MPVGANAEQNAIIAFLYHWGARLTGAILLIGIAIQVTGVFGGKDSMRLERLMTGWPHVALIGLWLVPVMCVTITGCVWVARDRWHWTGWIAIGIGLFLSSLWILK